MAVTDKNNMHGWLETTLGRLCHQITTGKLDANAMIADGIYPFFTCAKESYRINTYAFDCEALLISGNGANVGYVHYYHGKFNAYQRTYVISGFNANSIFLNYYLTKNIQDRIRIEVNSGNTPYITMGTLTEMPINLPNSEIEQQAIATALSDVDELIASLDKLIAKKRDLKQAAMQQLLTGKTRLQGFSGEWETKRLGDALTICHGKSQKHIEDSAGSYSILATGGEIGRTHHYLYDKPSVLIGRKGTIDKPQYMDKPFWTVDTLFYSDIHDTNIAKFIYYVFCMIDWRSYNEASGVPSLNARTIEQISFDCPTLAEQTAIATVLSDMDAEIAELEKRRDKTAAIKQGMMQELLTGRTRLI